MGVKGDPGARYIGGFYAGMKRFGRISEALLVLRVKGLRIIKDIPFFSKVLIHGKVSGIRRPIKGIDEVRKIYDLIGKRGDKA